MQIISTYVRGLKLVKRMSGISNLLKTVLEKGKNKTKQKQNKICTTNVWIYGCYVQSNMEYPN